MNITPTQEINALVDDALKNCSTNGLAHFAEADTDPETLNFFARSGYKLVKWLLTLINSRYILVRKGLYHEEVVTSCYGGQDYTQTGLIESPESINLLLTNAYVKGMFDERDGKTKKLSKTELAFATFSVKNR